MSYKKGRRPDGTIRRSQLLTRAGPGALVDLVDHAVIIGGLGSWEYESHVEGFFSEPRLEASALKMLRSAGNWKHGSVRLRRPPACNDDKPHPKSGIAATQFPNWYLCQNPNCRSLVNWKAPEINKTGRHICSSASSKGYPVVPFRFISACPRGHLVEILWQRFVHRGERDEGILEDSNRYCKQTLPDSRRPNDPLGGSFNASLYVVGVGQTGDITDYIIGCRDCGKTRGLQDLAIPGVLGPCKGWRPWLGRDANETCDQKARLLVRTASNAYFPQSVSVLSFPDSKEELRRTVGENWQMAQGGQNLKDLETLVTLIPALRKAFEKYTLAEVLAAIQERHSGDSPDTRPIREVEWAELQNAKIEVPPELPPRGCTWFPRRADVDLPTFLDRVVLIHALKEVRAQVGFTRIEGFTANAEGDFPLDGQKSAPLALSEDWIPAVEILGEGVFLAFSESELRKWEALTAVQEREALFKAGLKEENATRKVTSSFMGARLILLHSIAHMLITQISLECGYPASSIRERIYCHRADMLDEKLSTEHSRAGILLFTGTPGSEGTLGGLVEVGRDIVRHLRRAAERSQLCSNDPVCAQHSPAGMEEGRGREGAACHSCLLIAEPSCERMNRDLDREFVVPTVESGEAAFFREWLETPFVASNRGLTPAPVPVREATKPIIDLKATDQVVELIAANCLDETVANLVRAVAAAGLPLPDFEPGELPIDADIPIELMWADHQVAICAHSVAEPSDFEAAGAAKWVLLELPTDIESIAAALEASIA